MSNYLDRRVQGEHEVVHRPIVAIKTKECSLKAVVGERRGRGRAA